MRILRVTAAVALGAALIIAPPPNPASAQPQTLTTAYRSAGWVSADSNPEFTGIDGCQASGDGRYCSRPESPGYGHLYFSSFGTLSDFAIPADAFITKVHIRITGRATHAYVGLILGRNSQP